jgi:hypothetical protein
LKIQPRVYFKKYMRKRVYRYVRYYLEIPRRIAEPSLGVSLEARRFSDYIVIGPTGRLDSFSTVEKLARQNSVGHEGHCHAHVRNGSYRNHRG